MLSKDLQIQGRLVHYTSEFLAGRLVHASLAEQPASRTEERQRCPIPASVRCRL